MVNQDEMIRMLSKEGQKVRIPKANISKALSMGYQLADNAQEQNQLSSLQERMPPQGLTQQQLSESGFDPLDALLKSAPSQLAIGLGQGLKEILGAPFGIKPEQSGEGFAYETARQLGAPLAAFAAGGPALNIARGAAESLPLIGRAAQYLGKEGIGSTSLRQGLGSALFGASQNPEDIMGGAALGGALGAAPAAAIQTAKKGYELLSPAVAATKFGEGFKGTLSSLKEKISDIYKPVVDKFGGEKIYEKMSTYMTHPGGKRSRERYGQAIPIDSNYGLIAKPNEDYAQLMGGAVKEMHKKFIESPTFSKAHKLQSQLGDEIRKLTKLEKSGKLDARGDDRLYQYQKAREALKQDEMSFLNKKSPEMAERYALGSEEYLNKIVPFMKDPQLAKLATGYSKLKPKDVSAIAEKIKDDPFLMNQFGDQLLGLQAKTALPGFLSKKISPFTNAIGLNQMLAPATEFGKQKIPQTYDLLRQTLLSQILRGNQ